MKGVVGMVQARSMGILSPRAFQKQIEAALPRLEGVSPEIFLAHLRRDVGEEKYNDLVKRVTFGEEVLSDQTLVKRLIAREFYQLRYFGESPQSQEWREEVGPTLALDAPPHGLTVAEYRQMCGWKDLPFAQMPQPAYDGASVYTIMAMIQMMHLSVDQRVQAIGERA